MSNIYNALPYITLSQDTGLLRPEYNLPLKVTLEDSALRVITDFHNIIPVTITPDTPIDAASDKMVTYGVRLLFVVDPNDSILGLITSVDILGEKPLRVTRETGISYNELLVEDIMTTRDALDAIHYKDIEEASVGDLVATMRMFGRQHALVIDTTPDRQAHTIRGLISTTQISKQLGMDITPNNRAQSFAELEVALTSVA